MTVDSQISSTIIQEFSIQTDAQGRLVYMADGGLRLLGLTSDYLAAGLNVMDLIAVADRPRATENMRRILSGERSGLNHYTLLGKNGDAISVLVHSHLSDQTGSILSTLFFLPAASKFADLMGEHQQMLQTVMEVIPCGLAMVNAQGRIAHWNPAAESLTGLSRMQVMGKTCQEVFNCPNHAQLCPLARGLTMPATILCADLVIKSQGRSIHLQKTTNYIFSSDGRITGAIESFSDLTPQREAEAALHEARELVESARHAKRHFMANMNHEIRTPLNGILGFLDLMLSEDSTPSQREYLLSTQRSAHLLMDLINDILDFTIVDKGNVHIEHTGFSLSSIINSAIARQYDLTQNKQVCIHSHVESDVPDGMLGDPGRLYQILKHIVGNGIKFTLAGEVAVHVARVPVMDQQSEVDSRALLLHFAIRDTGVGIPKEKLDAIFQAMSQVDESMTRSFGGLGIGLNLVHRLVVLLGGRIWMESEPGRGTTVHLILPFKCASSSDVQQSNRLAQEQMAVLPATFQPADKETGLVLGLAGQELSLAPLPLSSGWRANFEALSKRLDSDPKSAEKLLIDLKAEATSANQNTLSTLLFRLLLALRRNDQKATTHFYTLLKQKLPSDDGVQNATTPAGGKYENISSRR